ncbi:S-adenosyl-L-methionine-dependent methyltransferase [Apodospora peruviana]|uniref:S-adenosyl-L-methionine-dependent methyltransferase n=1 Tax=Apodospora peruviana TaxID=516989 RepID=A0AAE0LZ78_9PEZI|nr:S-adenosyl-L-methionine-dependent methyltransferase [Apodospora peruviana]
MGAAGDGPSPPAPGSSPTAKTGGPSGILPASHWTAQTIDDDDNDSSLGDVDNVSSTASLSSSILEYRTINGRTFHSDRVTDGQYWTPNDERQNESMDINHHLLTLVLDGKLFLAPIKDDVQKVIDIGTGTGMWAIDFADQFPNANVIGTDISPIQPSWVPPNLQFQIDDATKEWTSRDNEFDFIHMRYLFGSVADWAALYRQAFRCCKPGGWIEDFEASTVMSSDDGSVKEGSPMNQWGKVFFEGGRKLGRPFTVLEDDLQRKGMEAAGFVNINVWDFKCPLTGWPKDKKLQEMGLYSQLALEQDVEGYVLYMWSQVMGWSNDEIHVYIAHLRKQLRDKNVHAFFRMRVVYAQKPEGKSDEGETAAAS